MKHRQGVLVAAVSDLDSYTNAIHTVFSLLLAATCASQTPAAGSAKSPQTLHTLSSESFTLDTMDGNKNGKDEHYDKVFKVCVPRS